MSDEKKKSQRDVHPASRQRIAEPLISVNMNSDGELFQADSSGSENICSDDITLPLQDQVFQTNLCSNTCQRDNILPDYQVLTDASLNPHDCGYVDEFNDEEDKKKIGLSVSLHEELKSAILKKADEHRAREAKVLRVPEEEIAPYFLCQDPVIEKADPVIGMGKADDEESKRGDEFENRRKEVFESNGHLVNMMTLTSALASCAAERGKAMNMDQREENFGSDSDPEELEEGGSDEAGVRQSRAGCTDNKSC